MRAWVAELDGKIVGIGGFAFSHGRWFGFCDLKEALRPHRFTIARTAKKAMREALRQGIRFIYAEADNDEATATRFLTSLGFRVDPRTAYLYRWRAGE